MCYLTGYELWKEKDLQFLFKAWWVLFVFLLNILGFAIFWIWLARRRDRRGAPPSGSGRLLLLGPQHGAAARA